MADGGGEEEEGPDNGGVWRRWLSHIHGGTRDEVENGEDTETPLGTQEGKKGRERGQARKHS